ADASRRNVRGRGRESGRPGRAAWAQGTARFEGAVDRRHGIERASLDAEGWVKGTMTERVAADTKGGVPIRIDRVAKIFGADTDNPFRALKEVSVDIEPGEFVSVVGPSGCGKSTLMLMVAGLLTRSHGDIAIAGRSVTNPITDVG